MVTTALMAFLHHILAFALTACIVYEFIAYRKNMSIAEIRRIQRVDLAYGISAGLLILVGLLRVFFFENGLNFFIYIRFFWLLLNSFVVFGLFSIDT